MNCVFRYCVSIVTIIRLVYENTGFNFIFRM